MTQAPLIPNQPTIAGPVECLGLTFASDEERRAHFGELLRAKLRDPEFRKIEGFPIGSDDDILALSDPPYYTACPNPFIADFVRAYGRPYDPSEAYRREPFAVDVSEGKNDPIYNAHSYHTKVPHKAIMRYILHYTRPGDVVFDGFCGTGMTGVAAQLCGGADIAFKTKIEGEWDQFNDGIPEWGNRRAILGDLSPIATFIAYNYNIPLDVVALEKEALHGIAEVEKEYGWMYETYHADGRKGKINYTVWSDVFVCPECANEVLFWESAVNKTTGDVLENFYCHICRARLSKRTIERAWTTTFDKYISSTVRQAKQVPVLINYTVGGKRFEKTPDDFDLKLINKIGSMDIPYIFPTNRMPIGDEARRNDDIGLTNVHHYYTKRSLWILSALFSRSLNPLLRMILLDGHSVGTRMSRFRVSAWASKTTGPMKGLTSGTLYVPSLSGEQSWINIFKEKLSMVIRAASMRNSDFLIMTNHAGNTQLPSNSVDYIFVDPPFGANFWYSDLNFIAESWLGIFTNNQTEAVQSKAQGKTLLEYQSLMTIGFAEFFRTLKPGRWMTVEFSNTKASVWNAIQTAIEQAGFVVANVAALDKQQHSFKAVTTPTAVKQDLVISCYKPDGGLEDRFGQEQGSEVGAWDFIRSHLRYLPTFQSKGDQAREVVERTARILYDRLVAYFVRHGFAVPLSAQEFQAGLRQRFAERDGMYFLPEQVAEYERKRMTTREVQQLEIYVTSEASAIQWVRQQLTNKPQTVAELTPPFMRELNAWPKHEQLLELRTLLEENFLPYTGATAIPAQIVTWMKKSSDLRDLLASEVASGASAEENGALTTANPRLIGAARDRWYVPDPNRAIDLEQLRTRSLLKEFATYAEGSRKLKQFRSEAVKAGFKQAWNARQYETIVEVAERLPESVVQEDPDLLMYYDNASLRVGR